MAPAGLDRAVTRILHGAFAGAVRDPRFLTLRHAPEYRDSAACGTFLRQALPRPQRRPSMAPAALWRAALNAATPWRIVAW